MFCCNQNSYNLLSMLQWQKSIIVDYLSLIICCEMIHPLHCVCQTSVLDVKYIDKARCELRSVKQSL